MTNHWTEFLITDNSEYHWKVCDEDATMIVVSYHEQQDGKFIQRGNVSFPAAMAPEIAKRISEAARLAEKAKNPE